MSFKVSNIKSILLTTGGTVTLTNGGLTTNFNDIDTCTEYTITGTQSLASNFIVAMTSPARNTVQRFLWNAACTPGAFSVTILGTAIPAHLLSKKFVLECVYDGSAWVNTLTADLVQTQGIDGQSLVAASVGTSQLSNKAVDYSKFQDVAAYSVPLRASGTSGVLAGLAVTANSIIGRIAGDIVNITTATNGHVLKLTGGALGFGQLNFNELAGTLANAQVPDNEIALAKVQSTGLLASAYADVLTTAVTTEETAFSYTLPAGTLAADGKALKMVVAGSTAANATTKTIRVKIGSTTILTNTVVTAPNDDKWYAELTIVRASATASVVAGDIVFDNSHDGVQVSKPAVTWANANTITVTLQNGTANAGDITMSLVAIELLK
jgi:hypothetical protein